MSDIDELTRQLADARSREAEATRLRSEAEAALAAALPAIEWVE